MAVHIPIIPQVRLAPQRPQSAARRGFSSFSLSALPMSRLNEATVDPRRRLHLSGLFVLGLAALIAVLGII